MCPRTTGLWQLAVNYKHTTGRHNTLSNHNIQQFLDELNQTTPRTTHLALHKSIIINGLMITDLAQVIGDKLAFTMDRESTHRLANN